MVSVKCEMADFDVIIGGDMKAVIDNLYFSLYYFYPHLSIFVMTAYL